MAENFLKAENYYDDYSGWDLKLMYERVRNMKLPEESFQKIRAKEKATLLVLGSATPENLHRISQIDSYLRKPSQVEQDTAIIIDQNMYPLEKHKKEIDWIEGKDGWTNTPKSTPEFPYPNFQLIQGDMRKLPFDDGKIDLVVSDYTLNYLDNLDDINATFQEIYRTLSQSGLAIMSFRGNKKYPFNKENKNFQSDDVQNDIVGRVKVHYFPVETYIKTANDHGLEILATDGIGTDLCVVLEKK